MSDSPKTLSGFLDIFEGRLNKLRQKLKQELEKTKSERCRTTIKTALRDARKLKKVVQQGREENKQICPHCGGKI
jgi:wobble nucleotide-excising tRNase